MKTCSFMTITFLASAITTIAIFIRFATFPILFFCKINFYVQSLTHCSNSTWGKIVAVVNFNTPRYGFVRKFELTVNWSPPHAPPTNVTAASRCLSVLQTQFENSFQQTKCVRSHIDAGTSATDWFSERNASNFYTNATRKIFWLI